MTTPKHPQLTVNLTMNEVTTLRQALHALRRRCSALTIAATEKEFSRGTREWLEDRAIETEARIDSAARALDAAMKGGRHE